MIKEIFLKRLRVLHRIRLISALANEILMNSAYLFSVLALFSLVDFVFPMSFRIRRFALLGAGIYFLMKLGAGLIKIFKNARAKTCAAAGGNVLKAFELAGNKNRLASLGISVELIDEEIKSAFKIVREIPPFSLVLINKRAAFVALFAALVLFFNGVSAGRVIIPRREDINRYLSVEMKKNAVKGEPWEVLVRVKEPARYGLAPFLPRLMLSFPSSPWVERKLAGEDGLFSFRIEKCFETFKVRLRWKNLYSSVYAIKLYERPVVVTRKIRIKYPPYLNLKDEQSSFGGFAAFPGTVAEVSIKSSRKLKSARIITLFEGKENKIPMSVSGNHAKGAFTASGAGSWRAELLSREGLVSSGTVVWKVEAAQDTPPEAYILSPGEDIVINESFSGIDIAWLAEDDFGIKEVFFFCSKNGAPPEKTKIFDGYSRTSRGKRHWELSQVMAADDVTVYWITAIDAAGTRGESRRFTITLKDFLATHRKNLKEEEAVKEKVFAVYQKQAELNADRAKLAEPEIMRRQREIENNLLSLAGAAGDCATRAEKDPLYSSYYTSEYRGMQKALDGAE